MNVIVSNKNQGLLNSLDVDVIKSINGEFSADEIISTFSNFFFNRMFLDITALKDYMNISNIQKLSMSLEMDKVIILMDNDLMSNNNYLSKLISMGIYNFANNKESLMYLYNHPNSYKDVAHIHELGNSGKQNDTSEKKGKFFGAAGSTKEEIKVPRTAKVIGFKNATPNAGATTLIYMLKKSLPESDYAIALEVNKNDFGYFGEKDMYSVNQNNLEAAVNKFGTATMILIDLNDASDSICDEVIYLMEPSTIKLNKMMSAEKDIFEKLYSKKIVLNKSMLTDKDVKDFEFESRASIACNIPPLNDRENNTEQLSQLIELLKE